MSRAVSNIAILMACIALIAGSAWGQSYCPTCPQQIGWCPGGVCPPTQPRQQLPQLEGTGQRDYDVQLECPDANSSNGAFTGSGTCIARKDGGTVVITNHHVIAESRVYYVIAKGQRYQAKLLTSDSKSDIALLWVPVELAYVNIGSKVPTGVVAQFRAFDSGVRFRAWTGRIVGFNYDSYIAATTSVNGNSGGGVYVNGKLIGVLWGNRGVGPNGQMRLAFTGVGPIRRLLARVGVGIAAGYPETLVQVPETAPQQPDNAPPVTCPGGNCDDRISKIIDIQADLAQSVQKLEASIDARIDAKIATVKFPECPPGPQGPAGPKGDKGERGEPGPPGPQADVSKLELRINTLEAQLAELRRTTPVTWDIVPKE